MNIFILDHAVRDNARAHCDQHVIKMILESAQMLSTVSGMGYKPTHVSHPCTLWVGRSLSNWRYLRELAYYLNQEYRDRYNKGVDHKSWSVIEGLREPDIEDKGVTPFAQAMPEVHRNPDDVISAYRSYYRTKQFATWRCGAPDWWAIV